jgi:type II secretory ATPase GspE/PulE/Tfp pilus assembly ATPase PilB-like protein
MVGSPPCREPQCAELLKALEYGIPLVIVSGPVSSGKTVTIKAAIETL